MKRWLKFLALPLIGWLIFEIALRLTPLPFKLLEPAPSSTEFVDRRGQPLRTLLVDERRYMRRLKLNSVSPNLIDATLCAEDKRFWEHRGLDWLATARAVRGTLLKVKPVSGASTITQQLIKLVRPGPRTFGRKIQEIWLALALETRWDKKRILTEYFNRLDYGNLQIGAASASDFYFGKPLMDLSVAEAAFLSALPRAPTRLDPWRNFDQAQARQHWVLKRLLANRKITNEEAARARNEKLTLSPPLRNFEAPHFVDLLLSRKGVIQSGEKIFTTLDRDLNRFIAQMLQSQLERITDKNAGSAFAVVMDNADGAVLALAGSGDYFHGSEGQVNGAWQPRSPGSAVKPFAYLLALQKGAHPGTIVPDVPSDFSTPTGLYRPNNYNNRFHGPASLRFALGNSLNIASIRALELAGGPQVLHQTLHDLGLTTLNHPADYYGLGLTLGNAEVRLLELANAYATLARLGRHLPYRLLTGPASGLENGRQLFDPAICYMLADMLADNSARASAFGLNSWLRFDFPVACKTGTSSDYRDNWAVGYTPEFTVAVWVGNMDGSPMREITGVTGAAPAFHEIFEHLHQQFGTTWYPRPPELLRQWIDPLTGYRVNPDRPGAVQENSISPIIAHEESYDAFGRVILPPVYSDWFKSRENKLGELATLGSTISGLVITQPAEGAVYFLDPDLPLAEQQIRLLAEGVGELQWQTDGLTMPRSLDGPKIALREGRHEVMVTDLSTGKTARTWFEVRPW